MVSGESGCNWSLSFSNFITWAVLQIQWQYSSSCRHKYTLNTAVNPLFQRKDFSRKKSKAKKYKFVLTRFGVVQFSISEKMFHFAASSHIFLHMVARFLRIAESACSNVDRFPLSVGDQLASQRSKISWAILSTGQVDSLHFKIACALKPRFAARQVHSERLAMLVESSIKTLLGTSSDT